MTLHDLRFKTANSQFEDRDWRKTIRIVSERGWCMMDPMDWVLVFSFKWRGAGACDKDVHRGAFHVRFLDSTGATSINAYAVNLDDSDRIGSESGMPGMTP